jgi:hypothetical protein
VKFRNFPASDSGSSANCGFFEDLGLLACSFVDHCRRRRRQGAARRGAQALKRAAGPAGRQAGLAASKADLFLEDRL